MRIGNPDLTGPALWHPAVLRQLTEIRENTDAQTVPAAALRPPGALGTPRQRNANPSGCTIMQQILETKFIENVLLLIDVKRAAWQRGYAAPIAMEDHMSITRTIVATAAAALAAATIAAPAGAATPSACSLASLAGKWVMFKENMNYLQNSRCVITVSSTGKFTGKGTCFDYKWNSKSSAYSISGSIALTPSVNSCYVTLTATAAGSVRVRGEGAISAGKDQISGFFTNDGPSAGPMSLVKVP